MMRHCRLTMWIDAFVRRQQMLGAQHPRELLERHHQLRLRGWAPRMRARHEHGRRYQGMHPAAWRQVERSEAPEPVA